VGLGQGEQQGQALGYGPGDGASDQARAQQQSQGQGSQQQVQVQARGWEQGQTQDSAQGQAEARGAAAPSRPVPIRPLRAFGELGVVYAVSFGLGVVSAIGLLTTPSLGSSQQVHGWVDASSEIMQYVMQAAVVILGVGYFSLRRGLTLSEIFGRFSRPAPYTAAAPAWPAYQQQNGAQYGQQHAPAPGAYPASAYPPAGAYAAGGYPAGGGTYATPYGQYPAYGYAPYVREPAQRGPGWQFSRAFFVSMAGVLAFLISVIVYVAVSGQDTSAPDQGNSLWLVPVGIVVALAAGLGEEVLITGMVTTTLEQAGFAKRAWVIYLVAIAMRIPFHLYYGWAALGVVCFTTVNIWVYRRWRLLWPIVLAHAAYDAIEFAGSLVPKLAGLTLILLGLATFVMLIVIACIEMSDRSARRRFNQWNTAVGSGY
jgi:membrane protease YdiL (CAAX protease family)